MNLNTEEEMIFDIDLLPDPKQHIIHALYVGFDESENDDEKSAIERGLRAIVRFQERVGELPIKKEMSEIEKNLAVSNSEENITNTVDISSVNFKRRGISKIFCFKRPRIRNAFSTFKN